MIYGNTIETRKLSSYIYMEMHIVLHNILIEL